MASLSSQDEFWSACEKADQNLAVAAKSEVEGAVLEDFLRAHPLKSIMEQLGDPDLPAERVMLATSLLRRIFFNSCGVVYASPNLPGTMEYVFAGLRSEHDAVKLLSLNVLDEICGETTSNPQKFTFDESYIDPLLQTIGCAGSIEVSEKAADILARAGEKASSEMQRRLIVTAVIAFYRQEHVDYGVSEMRSLHVLARIASLGEAGFALCKASGAMEIFEEACNTEDILLVMNVLEMIRAITISLPAGATHFMMSGFCDKLFAGIGVRPAELENESILSDDMVTAQVLQILSACLWHTLPVGTDPTILERRATYAGEFLLACSGLLKTHGGNSENETLVLVIFHALKEFVERSKPNALALLNTSTLVTLLTTMSISSVNTYRGMAFHVFALLMRQCDLDKERGQAVFDSIGKSSRSATASTMDICLAYLKQPLEETRRGVFDFLNAVMVQKGGWGVQALFGHAGFEEWLLDHRTETGMEMKEWKFLLFEGVLVTNSLHLLKEKVREKVEKTLQGGPYRHEVSSGSEIATAKAT